MKRYLPWMIGVVSFIVYLTTMNPTVSFIDTGELAAVAATLGIPHPTGYPLFTILGRLVTMIPIPVEPILALNIFGGLVTAASVALFYQLAVTFSTSSLFFPLTSRKKGAQENVVIGTSVAGAFTLGFSTTFWAQSVAIEVYSLHLLFLLIVLIAILKGVEETKVAASAMSSYLLLFAFFLGLSFTNHMTTLLVLPACLFFYFRNFGFGKESLRRLGALVPFFSLGLSLYLF
ncbi:MAG: DUF2723 domain-containing protein, partial [Ignavibacteriales bacterium]|nr:DUF2723 domain-containing protein [Ignavibacteriales bacterium]